jgi:uncharacterized protein YneF (UPF0154 family)
VDEKMATGLSLLVGIIAGYYVVKHFRMTGKVY